MRTKAVTKTIATRIAPIALRVLPPQWRGLRLRQWVRRGTLAALWACGLAVAPAPGGALELRGPALAAASNFGQGVPRGLLRRAIELGVRDLRDAVYWDQVERAPGVFSYPTAMTRYPADLARFGLKMSLTVNNGHPGYDKGQTPVSPGAVAAFGAHAARMVQRYPAIAAVEVGNEINSEDFVSGTVRGQSLQERAATYMALLRSTATQVRQARPGTRILGGAAHSVPTAYLTALAEAGAAQYMDSLVLHPYATAPEHLARQIAVLRRVPAWSEMPIEITEYGTTDLQSAAGHMLRGYCQMALSGVTRMAWYPLNARGDGFVPLITPQGETTPAGRAYAFAQARFAGRTVRDVSPDPFTYACLFDERDLVIWGAPRPVWVARAGILPRDATGTVLRGPLALSETDPLVFLSDAPLQLGRDVQLGPQRRVADSFYQFHYPGGRDGATGFNIRTRSPNGDAPVITRHGQDRPGSPWTPYLGPAANPSVRVLPRHLLPGGSARFPVEIVFQTRLPDSGPFALEIALSPASRSADGVALRVSLAGAVILEDLVTAPFALERPVAGQAGERLEIAIGPGETATGDLTDHRFVLRRAD